MIGNDFKSRARISSIYFINAAGLSMEQRTSNYSVNTILLPMLFWLVAKAKRSHFTIHEMSRLNIPASGSNYLFIFKIWKATKQLI